MILKKICAVLLAAAMIFCCASCFNNSENNGDNGDNTQITNPNDPDDKDKPNNPGNDDPNKQPDDPNNPGDDDPNKQPDDPDDPPKPQIPQYEKMDDSEFTTSQLSGTDSLGRKLLPTTQASNGKYVGLFYNVNNSEAAYSTTTGIYDVTKIMSQYDSLPEWLAKGNSKSSYYNYNPIFSRAENNTISPNSQTHWYAEPLYGYYSNADTWVIRKQMELLGLIGVDFIIIDLTNYPFYFDTSVNAVLETIASMLKAGVTVPKATIMLPYNDDYAEEMLKGVYSKFYNNEDYEDVWFIGGTDINPVGKPMVIGGFDMLDKTYWNKFVFPKQMQWPTQSNRRDALPWMDYGDYQYNHNGIMSVSISQTKKWASSAYLDRDNAGTFHARGWTYGDSTTGYEQSKVYSGANFQQQWDYAMSGKGGDVHTVIVTGWNEWGMRKLGLGEVSLNDSKAGIYVDQFDTTFSRECEMLAGEYGDNYVFQLATNIRKFKGMTESDAIKNEKCTLNYKSTSDWAKLSRKYLDAVGETVARNKKTFAKVDLTYVDSTNRNDINYLKFANDSDYLYVQMVCKSNITSYKAGDTSWMNLYLSTGAKGWENYSYVINGSPKEDGTTTIERLTVNSLGEAVRTVKASADYYVSGKSITFRIPLSAIDAKEGAQIQAKAADNVGGSLVGGDGTPFREKLYGNAWDFYLYGDVAPAGRLNYAYKIA